MGTSPSNFVGLCDASARVSPPREPHGGVTRVQANGVGASQLHQQRAGIHRRGNSGGLQNAKLDPNIVPAYSLAVPGLPLVNVSTNVPNSSSRQPDAWLPTPLLRRPGDPLSSRTKFVIASATAVLLSGYFVLRNSYRPNDVAVVPQPKFDLPSVASLALPEASAPSAAARGTTVESRTEPEASLQPTARLAVKPTDSGTGASPPQTLPERGKQLLAASGYDFTCYLSASAVRQNHPGGRPSWTKRVHGYEGTKCWYPATQTLTEADAPSARARSLAVESRADLEVQTASSQPTARLHIKPTESGIEARPPPRSPERGEQLSAASGHSSTCFPSALEVRQNYPGAWPSWTLRALGHEGTRCWYVGSRTTANDHRSEMSQRSKETVGTTEKPGSPGALFRAQ
jgi:hypothetical protein